MLNYCMTARNRCQALSVALIQRGAISWTTQRGSAPPVPVLSARDYHRRNINKSQIKSNRKVGKHWNCRNARDKSLEIIHARNASREPDKKESGSSRLFGDEEDDEQVLATENEKGDGHNDRALAFKRPSRYSPPEVNLLTWAAKEQLRFLHSSDPSEWTPERLAECFPISVDGVKRLLRSKFVLESPAKIRMHDLGVLTKWKTICSGKGGPLSADVTGLSHSRPLLLEHAAGNSNLPMPPPKINNFNEPSALAPSSFQGYFESLICSSEKQPSNSDALQDDEQLDINSVVSKPHRTPNRRDNMMTSNQFMEGLLEELQTLKQSDKAKQYQQWLAKQITKLKVNNPPPQPTDFVERENVTCVKEKYVTRQQPSVLWDVHRNQTLPEAYIYTSGSGYQQPFGKVGDEPDKLNVPRHRRRAGRLYQKGDTFYDENGEFLYRVPGLK